MPRAAGRRPAAGRPRARREARSAADSRGRPPGSCGSGHSVLMQLMRERWQVRRPTARGGTHSTRRPLEGDPGQVYPRSHGGGVAEADPLEQQTYDLAALRLGPSVPCGCRVDERGGGDGRGGVGRFDLASRVAISCNLARVVEAGSNPSAVSSVISSRRRRSSEASCSSGAVSRWISRSCAPPLRCSRATHQVPDELIYRLPRDAHVARRAPAA
jgi:hypothetical protein